MHVLLAQIHVAPDSKGLPLIGQLGDMVNGVGFLMLLACAAGLVLGAGMMWAGNVSQNSRLSGTGKIAVLASSAGAFLIGGTGTIINFFVSKGGS
jgi:hypothetical protein